MRARVMLLAFLQVNPAKKLCIFTNPHIHFIISEPALFIIINLRLA